MKESEIKIAIERVVGTTSYSSWTKTLVEISPAIPLFFWKYSVQVSFPARATRMLEYTMEDLKKRNVNVVYIDTRGDNAKAIHLYKKMGFREFGRTIHFKKIID